MKNTLLSIKHETLYKYTAPVGYTIQQLRVIPRHEDHQRIVSWQVKTIGKTHAFEDAFGNSCEMLTLTTPHKEIKIIATGTVEIAELDHGRIHADLRFSSMDEILERGLHDFLTEFLKQIYELGNRVSRDFLLPLAA